MSQVVVIELIEAMKIDIERSSWLTFNKNHLKSDISTILFNYNTK